MRNRNDSSFSYSAVIYKGTFNFHSSQAMSRDINYIVYAPREPIIPIFILFSAVRSKVMTSIPMLPISFLISNGVLMNASQHRGPRRSNDEETRGLNMSMMIHYCHIDPRQGFSG